jgi:polyisoprenoid-binding protein YceI
MTFTSRVVERVGDDAFRVAGDLTLHGVTHEVELRGEFRGPVAHPYAGTTVIGFSLTGEIDREAFGLDTNMVLPTGGVLIGKAVKIAIEAEVAHAAAQMPQDEGTRAA